MSRKLKGLWAAVPPSGGTAASAAAARTGAAGSGPASAGTAGAAGLLVDAAAYNRVLVTRERELVAEAIQHLSGVLFAAVLLRYRAPLAAGALRGLAGGRVLLQSYTAWLMSAAPGELKGSCRKLMGVCFAHGALGAHCS